MNTHDTIVYLRRQANFTAARDMLSQSDFYAVLANALATLTGEPLAPGPIKLRLTDLLVFLDGVEELLDGQADVNYEGTGPNRAMRLLGEAREIREALENGR